jgi:hypothetical protein
MQSYTNTKNKATVMNHKHRNIMQQQMNVMSDQATLKLEYIELSA